MTLILFVACSLCALGLFLMAFVNLFTGFLDRSRQWRWVARWYAFWMMFYFGSGLAVEAF